jgi:hypothetical protein
MNERHYEELVKQWSKRFALYKNNPSARHLYSMLVDDFCYVARAANSHFDDEAFKKASGL